LETTTANQKAPAPGPVDGDWICIACEYPLKGLDRDGACPECGTRIALSLRDDRLCHAHPLWLMRVSEATTLILFCYVVLLTGEVVFVPPISVDSVGVAGRVFTHLFTLGSAWLCLGIWLLATPEYVAAGQYRSRWLCWIIRALATLSLLCQWVLLPILDLSRQWKFAAAFIAPAAIIATYRYLQNLARRIPDNPLALHAAMVAGGLVLSNLIAHALPRFQAIWPMARVQIPINLGRLIFILSNTYAIFILARFSTRLTSASNQAMSDFLSEKSNG